MKDVATMGQGNPPVLMHRPQRFGVLPTWSFWMDPAVRANLIVARLIIPAHGACLFTGLMVWGMLVHPVLRAALPGLGVLGRAIVSGLACGSLALLGGCLAFGISERLLRRKILANRRRAEPMDGNHSEGRTMLLGKERD